MSGGLWWIGKAEEKSLVGFLGKNCLWYSLQHVSSWSEAHKPKNRKVHVQSPSEVVNDPKGMTLVNGKREGGKKGEITQPCSKYTIQINKENKQFLFKKISVAYMSSLAWAVHCNSVVTRRGTENLPALLFPTTSEDMCHRPCSRGRFTHRLILFGIYCYDLPS